MVDAPHRIHYRLVPQSLAAKIRNFLVAMRATPRRRRSVRSTRELVLAMMARPPIRRKTVGRRMNYRTSRNNYIRMEPLIASTDCQALPLIVGPCLFVWLYAVLTWKRRQCGRRRYTLRGNNLCAIFNVQRARCVCNGIT